MVGLREFELSGLHCYIISLSVNISAGVNITGDLVVYNTSKAIVLIQANDEANGVFRFGAPYSIEVEEGSTVVLG